MIYSIFSGGGTIGEKILAFVMLAFTLVISLVIHEYAHGYTAYRLGDSTAKADGRLSLNPLHHLDPIGTIMMLVIGFGYAKPVPVNTRYFKKPRRDFALVSLAGPLSNFLLAFLGAIFIGLLCGLGQISWAYGYSGYMFFYAPETPAMVRALATALYYFVVLNLGLGLFNLIPIPPLDGSNILMCLLPNHLAAKYAQLRRYTMYFWIALIALSWVRTINVFYPLQFIRDLIADGFVGLWDTVFTAIIG
ncbi:MAG: site-2 protease family protein [Clostridia bacterium]|nr:site-2 protease family protein [Clostridia bacterium]